MGIFNLDFLIEHLSLGDFPTCVETGTGLGYSTAIAQRVFDKVYTIEIDEALYQDAKITFSETSNVTCIQGDSSLELEKLLPGLETPSVFFLDAHWSGDSRVDWSSSSWKGYPKATSHRRFSAASEAAELPSSREQTPLLEEITSIMLFPQRCVIYIDDLDKFDSDGSGLTDKGFRGENWSHLDWNAILEVCKPRLKGQYYKGNEQALLILEALYIEEPQKSIETSTEP